MNSPFLRDIVLATRTQNSYRVISSMYVSKQTSESNDALYNWDATFSATLPLGKETRIVFIKVTPHLGGVTFAKFSFLKPNLISFFKVKFPKK